MLHNGRQVIYPHRNWCGMRQVVRNGTTSLHGLQPLGQCGIVGTGICCYFYSDLLCPTTFKQPAYPAKTYSTGLGPASVPPKSAGSSTTTEKLRAFTSSRVALAFFPLIEKVNLAISPNFKFSKSTHFP